MKNEPAAPVIETNPSRSGATIKTRISSVRSHVGGRTETVASLSVDGLIELTQLADQAFGH